MMNTKKNRDDDVCDAVAVAIKNSTQKVNK